MTKRQNRKLSVLFAGLFLALGLMFGAVSTQAATLSLLDYARVNYAKNLSLPMTNHNWRIKFTNLNKASSATVSSSNPEVATIAAYNNSLKGGCVYVTPHEKGKTTLTVAFSFKSSTGAIVNRNYTVNLTVYGWVNPVKTVKVGKTNHASKFARTNISAGTKLCQGRALIYVVPKSGWTLKGLYVQGLRKSGSSYAYQRLKLGNKKVLDFRKYVGSPDIYIQVYSAAKKMNLTLLLSGD